MWLAATVGLLALWRRGGTATPTVAGALLATVVALVGGGLLFLPWVPSLLYQSENTGTPWGKVFRPTTMVVVMVVDFAGGSFSESQLASYLLVVLIALATFAAVRTLGGDRSPVVLVRGRVDGRIRTELVVVGLTLGMAWAVSYATSNTFASRYTAVVFPLFVLCVAAGVAVARTSRATAALLAVVVVAGVVSSTVEVLRDRTQAGVATDAVAADVAGTAPADGATPPSVVITCPDQLSPAVERALAGRLDDPPPVIPFPTGGDPLFVDWVDYGERNRAADPDAFLAEVADRIPADATVYVVINTSYLTFEGQCEALLGALGVDRDGQEITSGDADNFYEAMELWVFADPGPDPGTRTCAATDGLRPALLGWAWARICVGAGFLVAHALSGRCHPAGRTAPPRRGPAHLGRGLLPGAGRGLVRRRGHAGRAGAFFPAYPGLAGPPPGPAVPGATSTSRCC